MSGAVTCARLIISLLACPVCGLVSRPGRMPAYCSRCGTRLYSRKPDSIGRTWALLIAAYLFYIPANVLPVMETGSLFGSEAHTIMSGVVALWTTGWWALALLVFIASVVVPLLKLIALTWLVVTIQRRSSTQSPMR